VSAPHFFDFFNFLFLKKKLFMPRARQYCATCQVSKVTHVKSLSKSQFGPYICYFDYILVDLF